MKKKPPYKFVSSRKMGQKLDLDETLDLSETMNIGETPLYTPYESVPSTSLPATLPALDHPGSSTSQVCVGSSGDLLRQSEENDELRL